MSKPNQQNRKFHKRCHGDRFIWQTVQIPDLVFRHDKKEYKASRIASINMEQADNVPVYPVTAFRPGVGMKRACDVKVIAIPIRDDDEARCVIGFVCPKCGKTFNARLMGQATLIAHLNPDITTEELLPIGNMIVKVKFRKGTNCPAIANHPETGAFMVPSEDWKDVLGQGLELNKEYEVAVAVELDGRQVATPVDTVSNVRSTSVALALLATKTGFITEYHETNLESPHGKWVHMLIALGIKPDKVKTVTKEEVKSAYRQRSKIYNTDKKESSTSAVKPQMLELYKKLQQMVNEAKKMAEAYIDKRDGNVAPADAPAEVVPQPDAAQVEVKAPTMVKVVRSPTPTPAQEAVSEKVEAVASPSAPAVELPETVTDPAPAEEVIVTETAAVEVNSNEAAEEPAPAVEEKAPARLAGEDLDKLAAALANVSIEQFNGYSNAHKKMLRNRAQPPQAPKASVASVSKKRSEKPKNGPKKGLEALADLKVEK